MMGMSAGSFSASRATVSDVGWNRSSSPAKKFARTFRKASSIISALAVS